MSETEQKSVLSHIIKTYFKIVRTSHETFGFGLLFFYFLLKVPLKLIYIFSSLMLDNLFFPGFRKVKIEKPIFIIGHPRSATSFFHSLFTSLTKEFLVFYKYDLFHPSLLVKKVLEKIPVLRVPLSLITELRYTPHRNKTELGKVKKKKREGAKKFGGWKAIGNEEELLFVHLLDSQFSTVETPLGFADEGYDELTYNDRQSHADSSMRFLEGCFKRQIYHTKRDQIIAKMNFSLFRLNSLRRFFPDARYIFILRSPLETMPSHLSAQRAVLDITFGLHNIPQEKLKRFYENRYRYNLEFYKDMLRIIDSKVLTDEQLLVIRFDEIKHDLKGVLERMKQFSGLHYSPELEAKMLATHEQQSSYQRKHVNLSLEEFGISEEQIRADFSCYFDYVAKEGEK